jgi:hypothetical protein
LWPDERRRRGASEHDTGDLATRPEVNPAVLGMPLRFLRWEGVVLMAAALSGYFAGLDEPWWLAPMLLFVPDVFIAG